MSTTRTAASPRPGTRLVASYRATRARRSFRRLVRRLGLPYVNLYKGATTTAAKVA